MKVTAAVVKAIKASPVAALGKMSADDIADVIQEANHRYFNKGEPLFSDQMYDEIKEALRRRDPDHPILKTVGAAVEERKVKLPYWMGSMDKVKNDDKELEKWLRKYSAGDVVISDKLDGISALLFVCNGVAKLYTRGNGVEGQDASHLIPFVQGLPKNVLETKTGEFTVRGELILTRADFDKDLGKNGRNTVAGVINAKKPDIKVARLIRFVAYELVAPELMSPSKALAFLKQNGFEIAWHRVVPVKEVTMSVLSDLLVDRRKRSAFEVDGIVIVHDATGYPRVAGENPKHAFAFKSIATMNSAEVVVLDVEWNISKDGFFKPVVLFDGVHIGGVTVKRATGNNARFIVDNGIGPGARIIVTRSGDVIPAITSVLERADEPSMPQQAAYKWNETSVDLVVSNSSASSVVAFKNVEYFFSKVKVPGLSTGTLKRLYDAGIDTVGKVLTVNESTLLRIDGFKEKSAHNLVNAIKERFSDMDPLVLMGASNSFGRGIGTTRIAQVAQQFPAVVTDDKFSPTFEQLTALPGFETKTSARFIEGLAMWRTFAKENGLLRYIKSKVAAAVTKKVKQNEQIFEDTAFLFTGVRSKDAEAFILARGGVIKSSLSKNVDILICKDPDAAKVQKARDLGVKTVITLAEFNKKYGVA
jgi:NAD-dependent DNA ligase